MKLHAGLQRALPRPMRAIALICGIGVFAIIGSAPASSQYGGADIAANAHSAAEDLRRAILALGAAQTGRDQVAALGQAIGSYEAGMGVLRSALRQATVRETALLARFEAQRDRVARVLGVLAAIDAQPGPLLLTHPAGPLGTVRAGMMLSDLTPALQSEVDTLRAELQELADLRRLQDQAETVLKSGLDAAQLARTQLSQAIAARTDLPRRLTEDPESLQAMISDADTLEAVSQWLSSGSGTSDADTAFLDARGTLQLPVRGTVLHRAGESDAAGIARPGLVVAVEPQALVIAPWAGTIRYRGPLLDYGNVMLIEPSAGYLLVIAGLDTVFREVGEIVAQGAPLGLMGGFLADPGEFLIDMRKGTGATGKETLYIELRQGGEPLDPAPWFTETKE